MLRLTTLILSLFLSSFCHATTVSYSINQGTGNTYIADLTIINDTLPTPLEELSIFFNFNDYQNLQILAAPAGWDPLAIQPDTNISDDGFFDFLALNTGIATNQTLSGFSIAFEYLPTDGSVPGNWAFDVVNPNTFAVLDSGNASLVPIPASIWLFASGFVFLQSLRNRHK